MPDPTSPIFGFTEPTVGADNGTWGGILNTNVVNLDTYLGVLRQAAKVLTIGATTTLDFNAPASVFKLTVTQATTIAIANTPANVTSQQLSTMFTLILVNGGAFAVTWPGSFVWSGGSAPNLQVSGTDIVVGWSPDNGTTWYTSALSSSGKAALSKVGQNANVSTTSTSDISLGTIPLGAGKLGTNGDILRIQLSGRFTHKHPASAIVRFKFGASVNLAFTLPSLQDSITRAFNLLITVTRTGAATQQIDAFLTRTDGSVIGVLGSAVLVTDSLTAAGTENLANPVTIDFRGNVGNVIDTLSYDAVIVEAAAQ